MPGGRWCRASLNIPRSGEESMKAVDLGTIIDDTLQMVQYKIKLSELDIIRNFSSEAPKIKGNLVQLEEVFFNLLDNAYDSIVERRILLAENGFRGKME